MLDADPTLADLRGAGAERGVDERHTVLSAPRPADCSWARDSHRHRMGADQRLAGSVLAQHVARPTSATATCAVSSRSMSPTGTSRGSNGRSAMQCTREEVMREVWKQLKRSINFDRELLRDEDLHSWFLDPDIQADRASPGISAQRRAAAGQPDRHLDAAPRGDDCHSESVPGVRLRAHAHRPRHHGRRQ